MYITIFHSFSKLKTVPNSTFHSSVCVIIKVSLYVINNTDPKIINTEKDKTKHKHITPQSSALTIDGPQSLHRGLQGHNVGTTGHKRGTRALSQHALCQRANIDRSVPRLLYPSARTSLRIKWTYCGRQSGVGSMTNCKYFSLVAFKIY